MAPLEAVGPSVLGFCELGSGLLPVCSFQSPSWRSSSLQGKLSLGNGKNAKSPMTQADNKPLLVSHVLTSHQSKQVTGPSPKASAGKHTSF